MKRRQFLRAAAGTTAFAAVGGGAMQTDRFAPVGESEALGVTATIIGAATLSTAVSVSAGAVGMYLYGPSKGEDVELDESANSIDRIWSIGNAIADTRAGPKGTRTEIQDEMLTPGQGQTAYANAAMSEIRSGAASKVFSGDAKNAEQEAYARLSDQTTRALIAEFESWNQAVLSLAENNAFVEAIESGNAGNLHYDSNPVTTGTADMFSTPEQVDPIESTSPEGETGYVAWRLPMDGKLETTEPTVLREQPLEVVGFFADINGSKRLILPIQESKATDLFTEKIQSSPVAQSNGSLTITHPDLESVEVINGTMYQSLIQKIESEYNYIIGNLPDYVQTLVNGLEQGTISPEAVLGPAELGNEYASSNKRGQLAREMMAIGAQVPGDVSSQVKISHPELQADSLWTDLYLRLPDGSDLSIDGPMTVSTDQYNSALIGYTGQVSGDYQTRTLTDNSPLEILEIDTQDQETYEDETLSVGTGGKVELGSTDDLPEPYHSPEQKYQDYSFVIRTESGESYKAAKSELVVQDGTVTLPSSTLSEGQSIATVTSQSPIKFKQTSQGAPDPANYDAKTAEENLERIRDINEQIEEAIETAEAGGGYDFGGGIPTLPGLGVIETVIVGILAAFGVNLAFSS